MQNHLTLGGRVELRRTTTDGLPHTQSFRAGEAAPLNMPPRRRVPTFLFTKPVTWSETRSHGYLIFDFGMR